MRHYALMGFLNVTPDSFSDGGLFLTHPAAIARGKALIAEGATIVDVGGESTRPRALPVSASEEASRVVAVIDQLSTASGARISVDTSKASVARAAIAAGASMVNDVTALRGDPQMAAVVASTGAECCLMHMRGDPSTMQQNPTYSNVVDEVIAFLEGQLRFAVAAGIPEERLLLDPGIGFGKTVAHNLQLLAHLDRLVALGRPVVVGTSRKSFLGRIAADAANSGDVGDSGAVADSGDAADSAGAAGREGAVGPAARLPGTIASNVMALERGATVFRVHDVGPLRDALAVAAATLAAQ